ncbi:hypothetical protein [Bacillus sp. 1P06AnD]|uniref:hypothetical protein n=1 Tax=Bacillus sp. 1P06AnD TaxID=3132208 RepID=UPI0039A3CB14
MIFSENGSVNGFKQFPVSYTLHHNNRETKHLAIMLPGSTYHTERPLFHYCTALYLQNNIDVLHINYQYDALHFEVHSSEELRVAIQNDVQAVVNAFVQEKNYHTFDLIGKSIGTIGLSFLTQQPLFKEAAFIWLTPLLKMDYVYQSLISSTQQGLLVMGDDDPNFHEARFLHASAKQNISAICLEDGNCSLEHEGNVFASIESIQAVMQAISEFMHTHSEVAKW